MGVDAGAPAAYLLGSGGAAVLNFPLWKASAMAQSGFGPRGGSYASAYAAALRPPYRGVASVVLGMTWARFAIFYGSDVGRAELEKTEAFRGTTAAVALPPLATATFVQCVNQPIIRGSVSLQDPNAAERTLAGALRRVAAERGVRGLWRGLGAGQGAMSVPRAIVPKRASTRRERSERSSPVQNSAETSGT